MPNYIESVKDVHHAWGYTYGPPMAVAPLDMVRRVVDFAVSQIPREKLLMGVPNYAYDWALPYIRGESVAESLSNVAAVERAAEFNAEIGFDIPSASPTYTYTNDGVVHEVWFEDARSVRDKFALADEYGLQGVSFWNIMRYFPQNWLVLNGLYDIASSD